MWRIEKTNIDLHELGTLANWMVKSLPQQVTIGITGTLGAGKTPLVQLLSAAAGIDRAGVTSPTFTLLHTHRGSLTIHHLDAYRVADEDEFLELGVEELFEDKAWTVIEWADRVETVLPGETLWISLEPLVQSDRRKITFSSTRMDLKAIFEGRFNGGV